MKRKWCTAALAVMALVLVFTSCLGAAEEPQAPIVKPYISIQPDSASYFVDEYTPKALEIEIWDWRSKDGNLSYQWYSFEDIEDYCETGGTPVGTGRTYTPTMTPEAGKQFFYYVIVTNRNSDALGEKSAELQSDVAVISFSAPGDALYPIISSHPASAIYGWGATLNPLKVVASLPEDDAGILSYQWYFNSAFSSKNGTKLDLAEQNTLMPDPNDLNLGMNNHYYVVVSNTSPGKTVVRSTSVPARITINPGKKAAAPRIEAQPKDLLFFAEEEDDDRVLTVEAVSPDRGTLSYQWFINNAALSTKGGTAVSEASASPNYTPELTDNLNHFYYVVVTNTNPNVTGEQTATTTSKAVTVALVASVTDDTENPNMTISIPDPTDSANRYQYIRGYGGMDVGWGTFPRTRPEDTELMYDPERMGYNILRIMIMPSNIDIEKTMADLTGPGGDRPDYYENVKIVNKYGGYVAASPWSPPKEWKSNNSINGNGILIPAYYKLFATYLRNFAQHMYDNGAPIYAISISNEPNYAAGYDGCEWTPDEMRDFFLEVGHFTNGIRGYGGGRELPYVLTMNGESANSPYINLSALKNPQSKAAIDLLARHVYGDREHSLWNGKNVSFPVEGPIVFYGDTKPYITKSDGSLYEVWMTEHNINSANPTGYYNDSTWNYVWRFMNDVDIVIRWNNENAFVWWASKRFYSMIGDGQFGTVGAAEKNEPATPYPRGWGLSHYSRYTIDTTRINVDIPAGAAANNYYYTAAGVRTLLPHTGRSNSVIHRPVDVLDNVSAKFTAFVSADGNEISLIFWTPTLTNGADGISLGTVKVNLPEGFIAGSATSHRSWGGLESQMFQVDVDNDTGNHPGSASNPGWKAVRLSPDRQSAYVDVPRSHILSVKFTRQ